MKPNSLRAQNIEYTRGYRLNERDQIDQRLRHLRKIRNRCYAQLEHTGKTTCSLYHISRAIHETRQRITSTT
jgi:hypothetical protein